MTTVWIVTAGEYSDKRVVAICSTEANAELMAAAIDDANEPEPMEIDQSIAHVKAHHGLILFRLTCCRTTRQEPSRYYPLGQTNEPVFVNPGYPSEEAEPDESESKEYLTLYVWATDKEHALKIGTEKRARWLAFGIGSIAGVKLTE